MAAQEVGYEWENLQQMLDRLGGISASRVAAFPPPGTATEADLLTNHTDRIYELADGVLVEKPGNTYESILAGVLIHLLWSYLDERPIGTIVGADGMQRLMPGLVRVPDVSYISWDRFPGLQRLDAAIYPITPDLAVEVISEGNTPGEMERKLREYFGAGARLVWFLYPETRAARVYTGPDQYRELSEEDTLDGEEVLPGFRLPIREWFRRAWPHDFQGVARPLCNGSHPQDSEKKES